MDELILRALEGAATPSDLERLEHWRSRDPANEARFRELRLLWEATSPAYGPEPAAADLEASVAVIVAAAEARRAAPPQPAAQGGGIPSLPPETQAPSFRFPSRLPSPGQWALALAAGVAALALGVGALDRTPPEDPEVSPLRAEALTAPRTLELEDGSFIRLAPGARVEVTMGPGSREVALEGRAFFAVAPDPARPFVIRAGDSRIEVLGTRFEVAPEGSGIRTAVVEGRVALSNPLGSVEVPGGSVAFSDPGGAPTAEAVGDVLALLDWPEGLLVFHTTPLAEVAREVERRFGATVRIEGPALGARRISAGFHDESFQEVVETLCAITAARCVVGGKAAVLSPGSNGGG